MVWYNFKTKEYEVTEPTDYAEFIPQDNAAQNLYKLLIENMGKTPLDAAEEVLRAACGK